MKPSSRGGGGGGGDEGGAGSSSYCSFIHPPERAVRMWSVIKQAATNSR